MHQLTAGRDGARERACYPWAMANYKEVQVERLYVRVPGTDKLRKGAAGRLRHLLADGWRETERTHKADHIAVRVERTGHTPLKGRLPKGAPAPQRFERRPRGQGQFGGRGGRGRR